MIIAAPSTITMPVTGTSRDHGNDERCRKQTNAVGERPRDEKDSGGNRLHLGTETPLQQLVRRHELAAKVRRDEDRADDHAGR